MLQTTAQGGRGRSGTSGLKQGLAGGNQEKGPCLLGDGGTGQVGVEEWASPGGTQEPVRNSG